MRDRELDLIAALVEGRLDDETEARALIDASPELRSEYEIQKVAFDALASVDSASLSDTERAGLRRDVWTELRAQPAAMAATQVPWYYRWVPVAAGMFVVVGLVAVINQGGSSDSAEVAQFSATTTSAGATAEDASGGSAAEDGADPVEGGNDAASAEDEPETSGVASVDLARALTPSGEQFYSAAAEKVRQGLDEMAIDSLGESSSSDQLQDCVDDSGLEGFDVVSVNPSPVVDGEGAAPVEVTPFITAAPDGADPETAPIAFVDLFSCDAIYVDYIDE